MTTLLLGVLIGLVALAPASAEVTPKKVKKTVKKQAIVKPVFYRVGSSTVPDSEIGFAVAPCPPGTVVTGGGFNYTFIPGVDVLVNAPSNLVGSGPGFNGWAVYIGNGSGDPVDLSAWAMCVTSNRIDSTFAPTLRGEGDWPETGKWAA